MPYSERKKAYNTEYIKENIKRIPLDVQKDKYDEIKKAARAAGESVNGYIKRAINLRMNISPEDTVALTEKYSQDIFEDKSVRAEDNSDG